MYKIKAFRNAQEFQRIFGIQEHGNGVKSRRNKILLAFYKSPSMWAYCKKKGMRDGFNTFFSITSMAELKDTLEYCIRKELEDYAVKAMREHRNPYYDVWLKDWRYFSRNFATDESRGIPSNGDVGFVRYVSHEENRDGKVYRMRAGRFYKRLLLESELGRALPQQVLNWMCEEFTNDWSSYVTRKLPHFTLHVDDDFQRIYSYGYVDDDKPGCTEEFGSCMMGDGQYLFYKYSVKAKAAYLTNDDDYVIARCVIFTDVYDEEGKKWRLAERQYAEDGRDLLKRCLVDALIEGGYIDGYKQVGVDCHQTTSYVDREGKSLSHKKFHINCELDFSKSYDDAWNNSDAGRILSYQDSFKYYKYEERIAYNFEPSDTSKITMLDTTSSYLEGLWDEYHGYWCSGLCTVFVKGKTLKCDSNNLQDFIEYSGRYIHEDDFVKCPICGKSMPNPEYYSDYGFMYYFFDGEKSEYVCSSRCVRELESKFKEHAYYDHLQGKYIRKDADTPVKVLHLSLGDVDVITCSKSQISRLTNLRTIRIIRINNSYIPMYSRGIRDIREKVTSYLGAKPRTFGGAIDEIIGSNTGIDLSQYYSGDCFETYSYSEQLTF